MAKEFFDMQAMTSTTAWALHDLGLATSFGGSLFGRVALDPATKEVSDPDERGRVVHDAWTRFSPLNLISHLIFAVTWVIGRKIFSGREIDATTRTLVVAKDALVATSVVSGVASTAAGYFGMREDARGQPVPLDRRGEAISRDRRVKLAEKVTGVAGVVNLISLAGIVGVTAVLAMKAGRSAKWSLFARRAP